MPASLQIGDVMISGRVLTAPMTGVSDLPFRRIASSCGAPYVATEMVACDAFARGRPDVVRRAAIGAKEDEKALPRGAPYVATEMVACDSFARGRPDVVRRAAIGEAACP